MGITACGDMLGVLALVISAAQSPDSSPPDPSFPHILSTMDK